jgi:hypothetical protein
VRDREKVRMSITLASRKLTQLEACTKSYLGRQLRNDWVWPKTVERVCLGGETTTVVESPMPAAGRVLPFGGGLCERSGGSQHSLALHALQR